MSGRPAEKIQGGPWWECEGAERQLGLDQRGRQKGCRQLRVSVVGPGERGSWLAHRGGTKSWPCEEGEDGTEILRRHRLAMPGRAAGQARCLGVGRVAENTPAIPAKCERRPQWVCFSLCARSYFTAWEAEGNGSHPSVHAAMSIPSAGIWLLGHMAFPATPCCSHWTPLSPFPPGSFSQLIKFQAVEKPCSLLAPPPPQTGGLWSRGTPRQTAPRAGSPSLPPTLHP